MNVNFVTILLYTGIVSFTIPLVTGVKYFKRLDWGMKLLVLLMVAVGITEASTLILSSFLNKGYHWIHHIYFPIEYTLFALIFSKWIKKDIYAKSVLYSIPVVVIFAVFNSLFLQTLNQLNSYAITLGLICYTIITLLVLYQIMNEDLGRILKNNKFWVSTGLLIFSAGDLAYFAFYPLVTKHYLIAIWAIHAIFNIIVHIFYAIGIICQGRKWD
jgi:hypothetical protein